MKIKVIDGNNNINIPVPMWCITSGLRIAPHAVKYSLRKKSKEEEYYDNNIIDNEKISNYDFLSNIDFKLLLKLAKELKKYKGLKLVEVKSKNGDYVSIEI